MQTKTKIKMVPYRYSYFCDSENCNGEVVYLNMDKLSNPRQCIHECIECGKKYLFKNKIYPRIEEEMEVIS